MKMKEYFDLKYTKTLQKYPGPEESSLWFLVTLLGDSYFGDAQSILSLLRVTHETVIEKMKELNWHQKASDRDGWHKYIKEHSPRRYRISYELNSKTMPDINAVGENFKIQEID